MNTASSYRKSLRSPIVKAWCDGTRTIEVLADLVRAWSAERNSSIHLEVVASRNAQELDARTTVLADRKIRELPKETKLSGIARSIGIGTGQAWISGRLRSPADLGHVFSAESIWDDDFALYSPASHKEISTLDALLDDPDEAEWYLLQITGSHDWIVGARGEQRLSSMVAVAREVFERHGAKLEVV